MYSSSIQKLIDLFSKFPTVGPRTAARFVFYLIKLPKEKVDQLLKSIEELKNKIKLCPLCFKSFEPTQISEKIEAGKGEQELCSICSDPRRNKSVLCIVEKEVDLEVIEKTRKFKGIYFILGGTISGFEKEKKKKKIEERVEKLIERIKKEPAFLSDEAPAVAKAGAKASASAKASADKSAGEVILALNPTTEGQNTTLWLQRRLKGLKIKITQLGKGLPVGGELEYADEETLSSALESRK